MREVPTFPSPMNHTFQVLILSSANSVRSIFAEYILRAKGRGRFAVRSAGLAPSHRIHPLVKEVLNERYGLHCPEERGHNWQAYAKEHFDFVITVCEQARDHRIYWPGQPVRAHWGSPHPETLAETPEGLYQAFVDVASQIAARANLFCSFPDERLVGAAWSVGTTFPFSPEYTSADREYLR